MNDVLSNKGELHYRIYENPTSALQINGKHIKYFDYIVSLENEACNTALKRIVPKIDLHAMCNMINEIPCINELQKRFYTILLSERKEKILDYTGITTGATITIKIEKRTLLLFWSDVIEDTITVVGQRYFDELYYQLEDKGTYRCTVIYNISGTGGADDVIPFEDTVKYE